MSQISDSEGRKYRCWTGASNADNKWHLDSDDNVFLLSCGMRVIRNKAI